MAILFLRESYAPIQQIALIIILTGSLIIVYEKGALRLNIGVAYAMFMACGFGISAVMDKEILKYFSPFTYVVINNFLVTLIFSSAKKARKEAVKLFISKPLFVIVISLLSISSWVGFLFVLQSGSVSRIFPIFDSLTLISTVGTGIIFLKEKDKLMQKIVGTIIIISGIFLL